MAYKKDLRSEYKKRRAGISVEEMGRFSSSIIENMMDKEFLNHNVYHLFLPISRHSEIDTWPLFDKLLEHGKRVVLSKSDFKSHSLKHYEVNKNTIIENSSWGIPEPVDGKEILPGEIDVVVVPLLAFDEKGYRVGYGKGFYDGFLAQCRPDVLKVGLSIFGPEECIEDIREEDVKLSRCVNPERSYNFQ